MKLDTNGDIGKFIGQLAKVLFYVAVIAGATWTVAKFDRRMENIENSVALLQAQGADAIHRSEYERVKKEANREHRRIWAAMGRKKDAEDIGE